VAETDAGVADLVFFGYLDDHCGREGGTAPGLGDSVRLSTSFPHGAGGGGGVYRDLPPAIGS
jgi:hypothetical protein